MEGLKEQRSLYKVLGRKDLVPFLYDQGAERFRTALLRSSAATRR